MLLLWQTLFAECHFLLEAPANPEAQSSRLEAGEPRPSSYSFHCRLDGGVFSQGGSALSSLLFSDIITDDYWITKKTRQLKKGQSFLNTASTVFSLKQCASARLYTLNNATSNRIHAHSIINLV